MRPPLLLDSSTAPLLVSLVPDELELSVLAAAVDELPPSAAGGPSLHATSNANVSVRFIRGSHRTPQ